MNTGLNTKREKLWLYIVLPAVILNLAGCIAFGTYYALAAQRPELVAGISQAQLSLALYALIFVVEWAFAISILVKQRQSGGSVMDLIAPSGNPWGFRLVPAMWIFVLFNLIFVAYVVVAARILGGWPGFEGLSNWQRIFLVGAVPVQAGFCEELIWRGYVITRLEARGWKPRSAILLSAASFALIHGFLPDKLLVTFLLGIAAGRYYTRERNLIPLMVSHAIVDVWSFGLSVLLR